MKNKGRSAARGLGGMLVGRISAGILFALLAAAFALVIIMTEPQENETAILTDQPLMPAAQAVTISAEDQLDQLLASFPAAVLCCLPGSELTLIDGTSYDVPFEDGVARIAEMRYNLPEGGEIRLTSIYPARASTLLQRDGYDLIGDAELVGMEAVRMSRKDSIRVHAQHSEAFYVLTAPAMSYGELSGLAAGIQRLSLTE